MSDWQRLRFDENKAESEESFLLRQQGFVETRSYGDYSGDNSRIVVARKGCGKTASLMALGNRSRQRNLLVHEIALTDFSPKLFFSCVDEIMRQIPLEQSMLIRNIWRYTIGTGLMYEIRQHAMFRGTLSRGEVRQPFETICEFLEAAGFGPTHKGCPKIIECVEAQATRVADYLKKHKRSEAVDGFPTDDHYHAAEHALRQILTYIGGALVLIDDLDSWIEESNYKRMLPFVEGLVRAFGELQDRHLKDSKLRIKLFVPEDLFRKWDFRHMDKEVRYVLIRWDGTSLKEMIARRVAAGLNVRPSTSTSREWINAVLSRVFQGWPNQANGFITDYWGALRDPLNYMLLHTQYRPRDMIIIMNSILRAAQAATPEAPHITPAHVERGVALACEDQVQRIFQEYRQRMPELEGLVRAFTRKQAAIEYARFEAEIQTYAGESSTEMSKTRQAVRDLYEVGFIGKFVNPNEGSPGPKPLSTNDVKNYVQYSFAVPSTEFHPEDVVLIHPSFWNTLQLRCPVNFVRGVIEPPGNGD
jgi:hypothetical protein